MRNSGVAGGRRVPPLLLSSCRVTRLVSAPVSYFYYHIIPGSIGQEAFGRLAGKKNAARSCSAGCLPLHYADKICGSSEELLVHRLALRQFHTGDTLVRVGDVVIGGNRIVVMAGPCTVESESNLFETARAVKAAGAVCIRGGAFKTRTSPGGFQGMGEDGLKLLAGIKAELFLPVVTEITEPGNVGLVSRYADMLQIGSRNMQNTALLKEAGRQKLPVLLKRGFGCTVEEWLAAAEYILAEGNDQVVLCERGIRTFENSTRFSLDILSVPVVKKLSHLPILVDPSHAAGDRSLVAAVSRAAVAAGADGLLIEVNIDPDLAEVDSRQTITTGQFASLMQELRALARAVGREI